MQGRRRDGAAGKGSLPDLVSRFLRMMRVRFSWRSARASSLALLLLSTVLSCKRPPKIDASNYAREIEQYRADRIAELKSETGWLTLIGLFWLKDGDNKFGSDPTNEIVLP